MKPTHFLASCTTVSAVVWLAACSSKSSDTKDAGTGGNASASDGGSSASSGGSNGGNSAGGKAGGGDGGNAAGAGGVDGGSNPGSGGATGDGSANSGETGTGGSPATCVGADLQSDPQNCGSCGKSCAGSDCVQGLCEALLVMDAQYQVYAFDTFSGFVSQGKVYEWEYTTANPANNADDLVLSAPSTPSAPATQGDIVQDLVVASGDPGVDSVAFDPNYVYEAMEGTPGGAKGQVARKKLDRSESTGAGAKIFSLPAGPTNPDGPKPSNLKWGNIAVGSDAIFLSGTTQINGFFHPVADRSAIYRIALPLGTDTTKEPTAIISNRGENITDLSVFGNTTAGQHVFWLEYDTTARDSDAGAGSDYFVFTAPATGGTPVLLDDATTSAGAFASDGTYVYWTEINALGRLMRCPLSHLGDASQVKVVADVDNAQEGIAFAGEYVYTMELTDPGPVFRINTATGEKELLGNRTIPPSEKETRILGVDSGFVYMSGLDAKVWRLPSVP